MKKQNRASIFLPMTVLLAVFLFSACSSARSSSAAKSSADKSSVANSSVANATMEISSAENSSAANSSVANSTVENSSAEPSSAAYSSAEEEPAFNSDNQAYWREVLQHYRKDDEVHQVMLVRCTEGSNAIVQFYNKETGQNNAWSLVFETDAYIGKEGAGKMQEGDARTPYGDFGILSAFGILDNPGTKLEYIDVTETTYVCDEEGEYYNQIIDTEETGHDCNGEEMYIYTPEYNYGIATDYNAEGVWPNGSAIFLHCKGAKVFTGGCVAIDQKLMKTVLEMADPGMRIIIHEEYKDQL